MVQSGFRLAVLTIAVLSLTGCLAENENTIIADPVDLRPYEGFWVKSKGDVANILSIKAGEDGRSASVKFVSIDRNTQEVTESPLRVQATVLNDVLYFEATGPLGTNKAEQRMFGRFHLGTTETPDDRDKLTLCFAEVDAMKAPVEKGALKGTVVREGSSWFSDTKVRITSSTGELRAYLSAHPLQCQLHSWSIFIRSKPHFPTSR